MSDYLTSLTPEQEENLRKYRDEWIQITRSCEPADRGTAERVFKEMFIDLGKPEPEIIWCLGPAQGTSLRINKEKEKRGGKQLTKEEEDEIVSHCLSWPFRGQHESSWPAFYLWPHIAIKPIHTPEQLKRLMWWVDLAKSCGWWAVENGTVFVCERPLKQMVDQQGNLHCEDGPAVLCRDGLEVYCWHGVRVPKDVIVDPASITCQSIEHEDNAEIRRIMIQRYGFDRYLRDGKFTLEQQDDFGKLYRKKVSGEPDMVFVEVINATPEEDGSYKHYVLPVRSATKTAHEAVSSSFGLTTKEYYPSFES